MLTSKNVLPIVAIGVLALAIVALVGLKPASAEIDSVKCTTSTITAVAVGNQLSTQVLATSTNDRAWARIQQVRDSIGVATSSVFIAFNSDVRATTGNGLELSTSTPTIDFGINTPFPYTGAVQVITNAGSTTLRVTECKYASF